MMWILIALASNINGHVVFPDKFATLPDCVKHVADFRAELKKQYPTIEWRDVSCYVTQGPGSTY